MKALDIWLESSAQPVGYLVKDDDASLAFAYTSDWLSDPDRHALSLSMPLSDEGYGDQLVRSFFGNLLQENDLLDSVMQRENLARDDIAGLLEHLGADCSGAVSVMPRGAAPPKRPGDLSADYDAIDDAAFADLVKRLADGRALPEEMRDPSPVAGVRRKMSLTVLPDDRFAIPKPGSGAPTTHILKLPDPSHRHEARDEAFVTELAAQCGLPVGSSYADMVHGHNILLITRFDRVIEGNFVHRRHVEDFAQAAGLPAGLKYERKGRAGRRFDAATIGALLAATDQPARARDTFLRMTLFNLLIGNNDNHAKNNGLLYGPGGSIMLAPFYDLVPVGMVSGFTPELAFNIGQARFFEDITPADLLHFCVDIGLPPSGAAQLLTQAASDIVARLEILSAGFPREMKGLDMLFGERASRLNALLALSIPLRERDTHVVEGGGWRMS